jgi:(heptosyl)LPS beta-1,4-glucosyltransferase
VEYREWAGFAGQKNAVIARARNRWVLLLDADEWIGPEARDEIRDLFESGRIESADVWSQPRRMHFLGRPLRFGGFGSERIERLSRNTLRYLPARVHETPDLSAMRVLPCGARIEHDPVRALPEYRAKLARYADLWAGQRHADGRRCGPLAPALHAVAGWIKGAILRLGLLDGRAGWIFHACNFAYVHRKYARLRELSR